MSETLTAAVVLLATTGAGDGSKTSGSVVSVNCGKVKSGGDGEEVEVGEYELAGPEDVLLDGMGE